MKVIVTQVGPDGTKTVNSYSATIPIEIKPGSGWTITHVMITFDGYVPPTPEKTSRQILLDLGYSDHEINDMMLGR